MAKELSTKNFKKLDFKFEKSAIKPNQYPKNPLPEFAFIGRSNVGKSSLINKVCNNKNLAKTSKTPGRTQMANFFKVENFLRVVDLPGYGFAKTSQQKTFQLGEVIYDYLTCSDNLKLLFLLIDSRHELKNIDREMLQFCADHAIATQIILTKCDKLSMSSLQTQEEMISSALNMDFSGLSPLLLTSSTKSRGINEIQAIITKLYNSN